MGSARSPCAAGCPLGQGEREAASVSTGAAAAAASARLHDFLALFLWFHPSALLKIILLFNLFSLY